MGAFREIVLFLVSEQLSGVDPEQSYYYFQSMSSARNMIFFAFIQFKVLEKTKIK